MKKVLQSIILLLMLLATAYAQDIYGDGEINIADCQRCHRYYSMELGTRVRIIEKQL